MNQSSINATRISDVYEKGIEDFLEFAKQNGATYYCPCVNCVNGKRLDIELIHYKKKAI